MKTRPTKEEAAIAETLDAAKAQRYADIAMASDAAVRAIVDTMRKAYPEEGDDEAIVSGALTAVVRFGIQRAETTLPVGYVMTPRHALTYFSKYIVRSAELLLGKPLYKPN